METSEINLIMEEKENLFLEEDLRSKLIQTSNFNAYAQIYRI